MHLSIHVVYSSLYWHVVDCYVDFCLAHHLFVFHIRVILLIAYYSLYQLLRHGIFVKDGIPVFGTLDVLSLSFEHTKPHLIQELHTWSFVFGALLCYFSHGWLHLIIQISFQIPLPHRRLVWSSCLKESLLMHYISSLSLDQFYILHCIYYSVQCLLSSSLLEWKLHWCMNQVYCFVGTPNSVLYITGFQWIFDKLAESMLYFDVSACPWQHIYPLSWFLVNVCSIKAAKLSACLFVGIS